MKKQLDLKKSHYGGASLYYLNRTFLEKMARKDPL
jgi:hypothetical protein